MKTQKWVVLTNGFPTETEYTPPDCIGKLCVYDTEQDAWENITEHLGLLRENKMSTDEVHTVVKYIPEIHDFEWKMSNGEEGCCRERESSRN